MIKTSKKLISALLVLCMVIAMLPMGAVAADSKATSDSVTLDYGIVHLDCGRKYFSVASIKEIIDATAEAGMNYVQLAIGNDGLRFLLDDMELTVDGATYDSDAVKNAIHAGNEAYHNFDVDELSQAEMDEIIDYAKTVGVGIIPLINTPGHMDAILDAGESLTGQTLSYYGSARTIDVANSLAVEFTQAVLKLYIDYFAGKGCTIFNMGADEYANDVYSSGGMGFGQLQTTRQYGQFVEYVNEVNAMVKAAGMKTMAFNDGIYYNSSTSYGTFDTDIIIQYWSSGWSGYNLASASFLQGKGHAMVNANGAYYYVVGKNDAYHVSGTEGYYHAFSSADKAGEYNVNAFCSGTVSNPVGAAYLIWCDFPGVETEEQVVANNQKIIPVFGATLPELKAAVWNGSDTTEPETPKDVTLEDEATKISVTVPGLTELEVTPVEMPAKEGAMGYDFQPKTADGAYEGAGMVSIAIPEGWDADRIRGYIVNKDGSISDNLMGAVVDGKFLLEVPHFSEIGIYEASPAAAENTVDKTYTYGDGSETITISGNNYENSVDSTALDTSIATVVVTGVDGQEGGYSYSKVTLTCDKLNSSSNWTKTDYYYLNSDDGVYYPFYAKVSTTSGSWGRTTYTYTWGYLLDGASTPVECGTQSYTIGYFGSHEDINVGIYERTGTAATPASTTIVITPVGVGTTSVVVGDTQYNITVKARSGNYEQTVTVDSTATLNQHTVNSGETATYVVTSGSEFASVDENGVVKGLAKGDATVEVTVKKDDVEVGKYTYTIRVVVEDLSQVADLNVEYFITNKSLSFGGAHVLSIPATSAYGENGVLLSSFVTAEGIPGEDTKTHVFWKATLLDNAHRQSGESGAADRTDDGVDFRYIRYWNGTWAYSINGRDWVAVAEDDQVVAYYMQRTTITEEITTDVVDWSPLYREWEVAPSNDWFWSGYVANGTKFIFMDFAVVYEDGTMNPESFPTGNTNFGHFDGHSANNPRVLNPIRFVENEQFEIWKVTVQDGTCTGYSSYGNFKPAYSGDEDTVWELGVNEGEPVINDLTFTANRSGKLIRIYVRARVTEDSLNVHYINQATGAEFHTYGIAVKNGTVFDPGFALVNGALVNNTVPGFVDGVTNVVSTDLSTMPSIAAEYRFSDYSCVNVTRSEDGKDVYLYYTFNNAKAFVVDFGLPLKIDIAKDLGVNLQDANTVSVSNGSYGKAVIGNGVITYTLDEVMLGSDQLALQIDEAGYVIYIIPATTVYYEEIFATYGTGWTLAEGGNWAGIDTSYANRYQQTDTYDFVDGFLKGDKNNDNYGFDAAYQNAPLTQATTSDKNASLQFSFVGKGIDLFANCVTGSANIGVRITDAEGATVKLAAIDLSYDGEYAQTYDAYATPVLSILSLPYGEYVVTLVVTNAKSAGFAFDGFRVYNTLNPDAENVEDTQGYHAYDSVGEAHPYFFDLRDQVIGAIGLGEYQGKYADQLASLYSQVYNPTGDANNVVFFDLNAPSVTSENLINLLENGPKNELYLAPGQAVTFKLEATSAQIGLRSVGGTEVTYKIGDETYTLSHSVDMFYEIPVGQAVTIQNVSGGVLSIGDVKVFGITTAEPAMAFAALTEEDFGVALMCLGFEESFQPEISMKWLVDSVKVGVRAVLQITTGTDVESLTVNGQALRYVELRGVRIWTYTVRNNQAGTYTYDVVAMNADGVAAEAVQTPVLTVTRSVLLAFLERFFG